MTAEMWIDLLVRNADALRAAGVLRLSVDGASAILAPREPPPAPADEAKHDDTGDPLTNPALYPSGVVPGYQREDDE
jgi:hypothetical protein